VTYSTENDIMDVINTFPIERTQEARKNKHKVMEVEPARVDKEEHERINKNAHFRNPKRDTFENEETPNEDFFDIDPNELITPSPKKTKLDKRKRAMVDDESILIDYE
jgi:hypothetical protein